MSGIHVNLYKDGDVGVNPHSDKEDAHVKGLPIYLFTLLEDPSRPRSFSIYDKKGDKLADIPLGDGSLLTMKGGMQDDLLHGVEKHKPARSYKARISLTVRAFQELDSSL